MYYISNNSFTNRKYLKNGGTAENRFKQTSKINYFNLSEFKRFFQLMIFYSIVAKLFTNRLNTQRSHAQQIHVPSLNLKIIILSWD